MGSRGDSYEQYLGRDDQRPLNRSTHSPCLSAERVSDFPDLPSRVESAAKIAVPEIPETVNYVRDILSLFIGQKQLLSPALLESTSEPPQDDEPGY